MDFTLSKEQRTFKRRPGNSPWVNFSLKKPRSFDRNETFDLSIWRKALNSDLSACSSTRNTAVPGSGSWSIA